MIFKIYNSSSRGRQTMGCVIRAATQLILLLLQAPSANPQITLHPQDTEAMIGNMTWFNCSTSGKEIVWYHYPVGTDVSTYVYITGKLQPPYDKRFKSEKQNTVTVNLVISAVEEQDAGRYVCQEDGVEGEWKSAHLIVLEKELKLSSNIDVHSVIGNNNCGIEPEELVFKCSVKFYGNIAPIFEWRVNENDTIVKDGILNEVNDSLVISTLKLRGNLSIDGSSYVCQTTRSAINQYTYTTDVIRILYAFSNFTIVHKTEGDEDTCLADSNSETCTYKWIWLNHNRKETVSEQLTVKFTQKGIYICEAQCRVKDKMCVLPAKLVCVDTCIDFKDAENQKGVLVIILSTVLAIVSMTFLVFLVFRLLNTRKGRYEKVSTEELFSINRNNQGTQPSSDISGLATIDNEVFISHYFDKYIEVYDLTTCKFKAKWLVEKLVYPGDMDSDKTLRLLYIFDIHDDGVSSRIIQLKKTGIYIREWEIDFDYGALSVTNDRNVVFIASTKNKLIEYTSEGKLLREIDLSKISHGLSPWHAVKLTVSDFVICYGVHNYNKHHTVVKVRDNGVNNSEKYEYCVDKESEVFGSDEALSQQKMNVPIRLVVQKDGTILVADQQNSRVFRLNSNFQFDVDIFSKQRRLIKPRRMCLDEESQTLIICDHSKVLIWNLKKSQGQWLHVKHKTE